MWTYPPPCTPPCLPEHMNVNNETLQNRQQGLGWLFLRWHKHGEWPIKLASNLIKIGRTIFCRHWWEHREQIDKIYKLCTYSLVHSCIWVQLSCGKSGIPLATNGNSTKKWFTFKVNQQILGYNGKGHTHIYSLYTVVINRNLVHIQRYAARLEQRRMQPALTIWECG